jgi:hypothetical protein
VKSGIMLCGCFTLISAVIGLFIPPGYLFIIALIVASHAVYKATCGKKS